MIPKQWAILAACLAVAAAAAGGYIQGRSDGRALERGRFDQLLVQANERALAAERAAARRVETLDHDYQQKLRDLDARYRDAISRIGPVRVCDAPAGGGGVPADPGAAGSDHDAAGGDELPPAPRGRDIGPGLVELAKLADQQTQRLIACQEYVRSLRVGE